MSLMSAVKRVSPEDVPGAPSWFLNWLETQNDFNEQASNRINGGLDLSNTVWRAIEADLDHGVETRIGNPLRELGLRPKHIIATSCLGVTLGTDNRPTRALYSLGVPKIQWDPSATADDKVLVTATFERYSSGTWTPSFGGITGGSVTYSAQVGYYVRIGELVHFNAQIKLSAATAPVSTAITLSGLPFTPISAQRSGVYVGYSAGMSGVTGQIVGRLGAGSVNLCITNNGNFTGEVLGTTLSATSEIWLSGSYLTTDITPRGRVRLLFLGDDT